MAGGTTLGGEVEGGGRYKRRNGYGLGEPGHATDAADRGGPTTGRSRGSAALRTQERMNPAETPARAPSAISSPHRSVGVLDRPKRSQPVTETSPRHPTDAAFL